MIVTCATPKYREWLDLCLEAYRKSNPGGVAKVYLINFDNHAYKNDAITEFAEMKVDFSSAALASPERPSGKIEAIMRLKLTLVLYELILNQKNLFWVDADVMIMKDLSTLLDKLYYTDLLCVKRPPETTPAHRLVAAGAFGVSPRVVKELAKWSKASWAHPTNWWSDQVCLGEMAKEVICESLTEKDFSLKGDPEAIMFHRGGKDYQLCSNLVREGTWTSPIGLTQ